MSCDAAALSTRHAPPELHGGCALEAAPEVAAARVATLQAALEVVLAVQPRVRGAIAYTIARGGIVVRLVTSRGWIPVLLEPDEWSDEHTVALRLEAALPPAH